MEFSISNINFVVKDATNEDLDSLYNRSSLTLLGLVKDSIKDWMETMSEFIVSDKVTILTYPGKMMNKKYGLTGDNAYDDKLTIVSFESNDVFGSNIGKVAIDRFSYGGRWFDDIVDNNKRHMSE